MSKRRRGNRPAVRAEPQQRRSAVMLCDSDGWNDMICTGFVPLSRNPEIVSAVDTIARLIASMTIQLMQNGENGDQRVYNELSRKLDINPNNYMTRYSFVYWIVRTLLLEGDGNAVVYPRTENGYLRELIPIPPAFASFVPDGMWGYQVVIAGQRYDPDDVLHFVLNPSSYYPWLGEGLTATLKEIAGNLQQASKTERGFMSSKWKPSLVVKVDGLTDEFSSPEGREKLLSTWVASTEAGAPWLIPADQFSVEEIRPLSLTDLALSDMVNLDKRTAAAVVGVPAFVLGVGDFKRDEWNNFIRSKVMPVAMILQQEMTRKLLYSPEWYVRFNPRSLYNYDLKDLASVANEEFVRGIMTGNEVRDWIGLPPKDGLDELVILENYIPRGMIGDQSKLNGGDTDE